MCLDLSTSQKYFTLDAHVNLLPRTYLYAYTCREYSLLLGSSDGFKFIHWTLSYGISYGESHIWCSPVELGLLWNVRLARRQATKLAAHGTANCPLM